MNLSIGFDSPRVLDFDIEARPLGWYGGDWVHKEATVIAWAWYDDPEDTLESAHLTKRQGSARTMLRRFQAVYNEADIVTGHYIRGFDLPTLNAMYAENGLPPLEPKLASDTKLDLVRLSGISKSQENLGSWLGIDPPKIGMSMEDWRRANRLEPDGIALATERAEGDVLQHVEMRAALLERGLLGPPKVWTPGSGRKSGGYTP